MSEHKLLESIDCERVIGMVDSVGTAFGEVIDKVKTQLHLAGYQVETIKVSRDVISSMVTVPKFNYDYEGYSVFLKAGNDAREPVVVTMTPTHSAIIRFALAAAARLFERREKADVAGGATSKRQRGLTARIESKT